MDDDKNVEPADPPISGLRSGDSGTAGPNRSGSNVVGDADMDDGEHGKSVRDWLQLALNIAAAAAAVFVFFRYDRQSKELSDKLTAVNTDVASVQRDINAFVREKSKIEVEGLKGHRLEVSKTLRSVPVATPTRKYYKLEFQYTLKNNGSVPVEVSSALLEVYGGRLLQQAPHAVMLNGPTESGPVKWANLLRRSNFAEAQWRAGSYLVSKDPGARPNEVPGIQGGGGTGTLNPGESSQGGIDILAPADETDLVAFLVTLTLDNQSGRVFGIIDSAAAPMSASSGVPHS